MSEKLESLKRIIETIYLEQNVHPQGNNNPVFLKKLKLPYHNWAHNEQVMESALLLAKEEHVSNTNLIEATVTLHDIGNLTRRDNHENISSEFAGLIMPMLGYKPHEVLTVQGGIKATKYPQKPQNSFQKIICDADLALMGYPEWIDYIDGYRVELGINDMKQWFEMQAKFLSSHKWWTQSADKLYNEQKQNNLELCYEKLKELNR